MLRNCGEHFFFFTFYRQHNNNLASAVQECPVILPGCCGDSDGGCQRDQRWGLGCCPISSPRLAHWIVLWSLTSGGVAVCVCMYGVKKWKGSLELLSNPSC